MRTVSTALFFVVLLWLPAWAQSGESWNFKAEPFAAHRAFAPFIASRTEGRLAVSRSLVDPRFDLDAGIGLDMFSLVYDSGMHPLVPGPSFEPTVSFGIDIYGWGSRDLEIERNSLDHFIGAHFSSSYLPSFLSESRLRFGRLGTLATNAADELQRVPSRDAWMIDLELGLGKSPWDRNWYATHLGAMSTRFNVGARLVMPDVSSDSSYVSPSLGAEVRWIPGERFPLLVLGGLEIRYYPGDAGVIEQSIRAGVKYGYAFGSGVYLLLDLHNGDAVSAYPNMPGKFDVRVTVGVEW